MDQASSERLIAVWVEAFEKVLATLPFDVRLEILRRLLANGPRRTEMDRAN
jgi:hypothetical protein